MDSKFLSQQDLDIVDNYVKKATTEEVDNDLNKEWKLLQNAAKKFLNDYEMYNSENYIMNKRVELLKSLKETAKNMITNENKQAYIGKKLFNEAIYNKKIYLAAFEFDAAKNKFLQRIPSEVLFVYRGDGQMKTFKMSLAELALRINKDGRIRINSLTPFGENTALEDDNSLQQEHIKTAQAAYNGAEQRLKRFYETHVGSLNSNQGGLLMWKLGKIWTIARVTNYGDLKECYIHFLLTEHNGSEDSLCGINLGKAPYYSHELIANFYLNYFSQTTNKAAVLEEDVLKIFSVKSDGSQLPGIQQYLKVAETICRLEENALSRADLQKMIEALFPADASRSFTQSFAEKEGEKYIKDIITNGTQKIYIPIRL